MFTSHFQSFDLTSSSQNSGARLDALRHALHHSGVDGFLIPRADEHQNEYVPAAMERLAWLTGFTGSAGLAIVLPRHAAICVDGRYTLQVAAQIDANCFDIVDLTKDSAEQWLSQHISAHMRLAYDPWLITERQLARFEQITKAKGAELVALDHNPIDRLWHDRPAPPLGPITPHPKTRAGEDSADKLNRLYATLGDTALLISDPHNLCWLFNIRGADVAHTPLVLGYGLVQRGQRPKLFIDPRKILAPTKAYLSTCADLCAPHDVIAACRACAQNGTTLMLDPTSCASAIAADLRQHKATLLVSDDPITLLKARKNATEIRGALSAHQRDGLALVRFLSWLDDCFGRQPISEIDAVEALESFRRIGGKLKDISFPTISAFGANAASPHYRVTRQSNALLRRGFYLCDSGAQYEDGTTDVTRTIALGTPSAIMRRHYTLVLKGHIAIARAVFPAGTSGAQIDAFARAPLWSIGEDFEHGTGHGVGSYLSVHEGPQRLSKFGTVALEEGMILSNEPAFYKSGAYGIRLENLLLVERRPALSSSRPMLGFKTLTLAPFDRRALAPALLSADEKKWLNDYHQSVRASLMPRLDRATALWLKKATQKI